jgi:hypothetical protein
MMRYKPWLVPPAPPALPAQKTEVAIGCKAINIMTHLGIPVSRRIA